MNAKPMNGRVWDSAADDVLSVLVTEQYVTDGENHFNRAWHELDMALWHMPPGKRRDLLNAVVQLHETGRGVNWNNVADVGGAGITVEWFGEIVRLCDATRMGRTFDENVKLLREYGETARVVTVLENTTTALKKGEPRDAEIDLLMRTLAYAGTDSLRDTSAAGAAARLQAMLSEETMPDVSTGLDWLDEHTQGIQPAKLWYLAGPYKSSKTRVCYNVALSLAEQDIPAVVLSRENQERAIAAQFVAMLATRWLLARVAYDPDSPAYGVSPARLIKAKRAYKNWTPRVLVEAVDEGIKQFRALGNFLHIYDASPEGGRLSDITSIRRAVQRHKRLYGLKKAGDLSAVYLLDHLGLVKREGEVYERTSATSNDLQALSREDDKHPIALVVLAQLNEATIKAGADDYSAGVKGGGDPSADADTLLTTHPVKRDGDYANDRTTLKIKYNRWGAAGKTVTEYFHPGSGLRLTGDTAERVKVLG